jgi:hypothetical protein
MRYEDVERISSHFIPDFNNKLDDDVYLLNGCESHGSVKNIIRNDKNNLRVKNKKPQKMKIPFLLETLR